MTGNEPTLIDCSHGGLGAENCNASEAAVTCWESIQLPNLEVREVALAAVLRGHSVMPILRHAVIGIAVLSLVGCKAWLNSLAENGPWGEMLRGAPAVPNPANSHAIPSLEVKDQSGTIAYRLSSFSSEQICFSFTAPYTPESVAATGYAIEALTKSSDDRPGYGGNADLKATNSRVRVIKSHSEVHMVKEYVRKLNRVVEQPKEFFTTQAEVCFRDPKIPTPLSRFLLLYPTAPGGGLDSYAVWRLEPVTAL